MSVQLKMTIGPSLISGFVHDHDRTAFRHLGMRAHSSSLLARASAFRRRSSASAAAIRRAYSGSVSDGLRMWLLLECRQCLHGTADSIPGSGGDHPTFWPTCISSMFELNSEDQWRTFQMATRFLRNCWHSHSMQAVFAAVFAIRPPTVEVRSRTRAKAAAQRGAGASAQRRLPGYAVSNIPITASLRYGRWLSYGRDAACRGSCGAVRGVGALGASALRCG